MTSVDFPPSPHPSLPPYTLLFLPSLPLTPLLHVRDAELLHECMPSLSLPLSSVSLPLSSLSPPSPSLSSPSPSFSLPLPPSLPLPLFSSFSFFTLSAVEREKGESRKGNGQKERSFQCWENTRGKEHFSLYAHTDSVYNSRYLSLNEIVTEQVHHLYVNP